MKKVGFVFSFFTLSFLVIPQALAADSISQNSDLIKQEHINDSLHKHFTTGIQFGYGFSFPHEMIMPQVSMTSDLIGYEKKLSISPQLGLSSSYRLFNNKMEIGLGLMFNRDLQIFKTDSALINEFIADGYHPNEKYRETEKFIIHGNNMSAQLELAYYIVPKLAIQINVNRSMVLFASVKRELYSDENKIEKITISNGENLPEYIPFAYDRMTYSLRLITSYFTFQAGRKMSLKPGLRLDFQGLLSSQVICLSSVGVFLTLDLNR